MNGLLGIIVEAFFSAFGRAITDFLKAWRNEQQQREAGRTEQRLADSEEAQRVEGELADQLGRTPTRDEILDRLRRGEV